MPSSAQLAIEHELSPFPPDCKTPAEDPLQIFRLISQDLGTVAM